MVRAWRSVRVRTQPIARWVRTDPIALSVGCGHGPRPERVVGGGPMASPLFLKAKIGRNGRQGAHLVLRPIKRALRVASG